MYWLGLIPVLPLFAAGLSALLPRTRRTVAAGLAVGSLSISTVLALAALIISLKHPHERFIVNWEWFTAGTVPVHIGLVLDPLSASMAAMVSFVGLLIFIYSLGYMATDENFVRFFCFLSLFAGAMLLLVLAGSLLLLFIGWELVGLASYLLIGFWFQKPLAAAAAQKAFLTTKIGDLGFLLAMVWLAGLTGTLTFFDSGKGILEDQTLELLRQPSWFGVAAAVPIGLLLFLGAMGKSGQFPLHIWLPDAMEGPTPVSALIHAATMVAAGVFLIARVFPIVSISATPQTETAPVLSVIAFIGAFTAIFAGAIALGQNDIKRILAYSTISQLGYMFLGIGVGSVAAGMFHLLSHAFFKALLFLGAGSVIHGCHEEQDIKYMGGLKAFMPVTFVTYMIGMMALCGVPLFFSGFWSKDAILHAAHSWHVSTIPYFLGTLAAAFTAVYMTRQVLYVFFGDYRGTHKPHESGPVMIWPMIILSVFSVVFGFIGTPWWPAIQQFIGAGVESEAAGHEGVFGTMIISSIVVLGGIGIARWFYGLPPIQSPEEPDPLQRRLPSVFSALAARLYIDEFYELTVVRWQRRLTYLLQTLDLTVWQGVMRIASSFSVAWAWATRLCDDYVVNAGFDRSCDTIRRTGLKAALTHNGRLPDQLRSLAFGFVLFVLILSLL